MNKIDIKFEKIKEFKINLDLKENLNKLNLKLIENNNEYNYDEIIISNDKKKEILNIFKEINEKINN